MGHREFRGSTLQDSVIIFQSHCTGSYSPHCPPASSTEEFLQTHIFSDLAILRIHSFITIINGCKMLSHQSIDLHGPNLCMFIHLSFMFIRSYFFFLKTQSCFLLTFLFVFFFINLLKFFIYCKYGVSKGWDKSSPFVTYPF